MELKFSKVVNRELKKTEMYLYGDLGSAQGEVNGHYFAQELAWLGRNYDEIKIRVNSGGGDVLHGLSVVSEMMASKAYIIVSVDGIAASMAAVLLPAADRVEMNDYARIMIHSAYYADQEGSAVKNLTEKQKKGVKNVTDILTALLAKRGITTERIAELMKTDSWFDAESALTEKLIDTIVTTGKKAELAAYEPLKLVAAIKSELSINENSVKSMKKIASKFGLPEDATEETILAKIAESEGSGSEKMVNQLVTVGRALGTVTDENVEKVKRLAKADFDLASEMYLKVEKPEGDEQPEAGNGGKGTLIKNLIDGKKPEKVEKKWDELTEAEIENLRDKDRPAYAKLFKAHYGFEPVIE